MREFIIINIIISIVIAIIVYIKAQSFQLSFSLLAMLVLLPIVSHIAIISYGIYSLFKRNENIDYDGLITGEKGDYKFRKDMIFEDEINVIPLTDVLQISDERNRREGLLNVLKKDFNSHSAQIKEALKNKDSETSHYAASMLLETKRKMDIKIQKYLSLKDSLSNDKAYLVEFADFLDSYAHINVVDEELKLEYNKLYIELAKKIVSLQILNKDPEIKNEDDEYEVSNIEDKERFVNNIITKALEIDDLEEANKYSNVYKVNFKDTSLKFKTLLKVSYISKDKMKFLEIIEDVKKSDIVFDNELLSIVRFWRDMNEEF